MKTLLHFVFDRSGYTLSVREEAMEVLSQYLHNPMDQQHVYGLTVFNKEVEHLLLLEDDPDKIIAEAAKYPSEGPSVVYDAIVDTVEILRSKGLTQEYQVDLVVITKGIDTASKQNLEGLFDLVESTKDIHFRFPGANLNHMEMAELRLRQMQRLKGR